jgi:hypothetical protein
MDLLCQNIQKLCKEKTNCADLLMSASSAARAIGNMKEIISWLRLKPRKAKHADLAMSTASAGQMVRKIKVLS